MVNERGRPPKKPSERKTEELRIRLTAQERKTLEAAAGGDSTSTWARELLMRAAMRTRKK